MSFYLQADRPSKNRVWDFLDDSFSYALKSSSQVVEVHQENSGVATTSASGVIKFSSKYHDNETDLIYYGYRYYSSNTGRWLSRDPINELAFNRSYLSQGFDKEVDSIELAIRKVRGVLNSGRGDSNVRGVLSRLLQKLEQKKTDDLGRTPNNAFYLFLRNASPNGYDLLGLKESCPTCVTVDFVVDQLIDALDKIGEAVETIPNYGKLLKMVKKLKDGSDSINEINCACADYFAAPTSEIACLECCYAIASAGTPVPGLLCITLCSK